MKMLVLKFDDSVDLTQFPPETEVTINSPANITGHVIVNATSTDPPTIDGNYHISPVIP